MKGIAFTDVMNVARRAGLKSMTRRIKSLGGKPPYKVGEVLYVRERHCIGGWEEDKMKCLVHYDDEVRSVSITDQDLEKIKARKRPFWRLPGRYMLASFARDHIRVTAIRSERLRAITEADAIREGVEMLPGETFRDYEKPDNDFVLATSSFRSLWQSIHGPESWSANPEVWVIEFENTSKPTAP